MSHTSSEVPVFRPVRQARDPIVSTARVVGYLPILGFVLAVVAS